MGKISGYPIATPPSLSSMLIGTDANDNSSTKNFTISEIISLANDPTILTGLVPYTGAITDVDLGSFNFRATNFYVLGELVFNGDPGTGGYIAVSNDAGNPPSWEKIEMIFTSWRGSFYESLSQSLVSANAPQPVKASIQDTDVSNGVGITYDESANLSRIVPDEPGIYNVMFSAQLANSGGSSQVVDFWLRKGVASSPSAGTDIPDTNGRVQLQSNNSHVMAAWNYFIKIEAGEYVQLVWTATSTNVSLLGEVIGVNHPATPSVIITINKV